MKTSEFRCETKFGLLVFLGHPNADIGIAMWMVVQRETKTWMGLMVHNQIAQYLAWNVIAGRR